MSTLLLILLCTPVALAIHFIIVRPFLPMSILNIRTGRAYKPTLMGFRKTK